MGHTPGPWFVREPDQEERLADIAEGRPPEDMELTEVYARGGGQVCFVMNTTPNESDNARLIAAAPKLLAALNRVLDVLTDRLDWQGGNITGLEDAVELATKAIDKAEGRSDVKN